MTIPYTTVHPVERAAHRIGIALVDWSARHAAPVGSPAVLRDHSRIAFREQAALEARHRSWELLGSTTPHVR